MSVPCSHAEGTVAAINTANDVIVPSTTAPGYVAGPSEGMLYTDVTCSLSALGPS